MTHLQHDLPPAAAIIRLGEHLRHDLEGLDRDPGAIGASLVATSALGWLRAALAAGDPAVAEALGGHVEWSVRHAQGTHPGPFTESAAREWAAADIERDERRRYDARGKTRLLRRFVTDWTEA